MKKLLSIVLISILVLGLSTATFAAQNEVSITPRWTNTSLITPDISKLANNYSAHIMGYTGTTKIECTMVLYEKGWFGSYTEVSRNNQTANQSVKTFVASYTYTSGKTYKLEVTTVVTRNGTAETVTVSTEKKV
ncbi:MAG: hypothetical protein RR764_09750 [Oscillospiraceae bacterium]